MICPDSVAMRVGLHEVILLALLECGHPCRCNDLVACLKLAWLTWSHSHVPAWCRLSLFTWPLVPQWCSLVFLMWWRPHSVRLRWKRQGCMRLRLNAHNGSAATFVNQRRSQAAQLRRVGRDPQSLDRRGCKTLGHFNLFQHSTEKGILSTSIFT